VRFGVGMTRGGGLVARGNGLVVKADGRAAGLMLGHDRTEQLMQSLQAPSVSRFEVVGLARAELARNVRAKVPF
jgi:hypothetical protein